MLRIGDIETAFEDTASDYPLSRAYFFGSHARNESGKDSDVDLFLDVAEGFSLFDLCGITNDLQDRLGISCDILTRNSLKERIRCNAEQEAVLIYDRS